jgi:endonuclease YncB( thermonuclease family)
MYYVSRAFFGIFAVYLAGTTSIADMARATTYELSGRIKITKVSDGDSLRSGTLRIRLFGIDAPELKQKCADQNGVLWGCGSAAQRRLVDLIGAEKELHCRLRDVDHFGRLIMQCFNGSTDIGAAMVQTGHAQAYRHFSDLYISDERQARKAGKGVWQGEFVPPWEWRRQN